MAGPLHHSKYQPLKWIGFNRLVKRLVKAASIEKRVTPYIFRHTRLTFLANFMTEAQLCEFAGGEQGSDMPRQYVHLSGRDTDDALLKAYGLKQKDTVELKTPRKCVRCGTISSPESETCSKCGFALSVQAALEADRKKENTMGELNQRLERIEAYLQSHGLDKLLRAKEKFEKKAEAEGLLVSKE